MALFDTAKAVAVSGGAAESCLNYQETSIMFLMLSRDLFSHTRLSTPFPFLNFFLLGIIVYKKASKFWKSKTWYQKA